MSPWSICCSVIVCSRLFQFRCCLWITWVLLLYFLGCLAVITKQQRDQLCISELLNAPISIPFRSTIFLYYTTSGRKDYNSPGYPFIELYIFLLRNCWKDIKLTILNWLFLIWVIYILQLMDSFILNSLSNSFQRTFRFFCLNCNVRLSIER